MSVSTITSTAAGSAYSMDPSEFLKKMFSRMDGDGDGKVTQEEFSTAMAKRIGKSDDSSASQPDAESIFTQTDTDADGAITFDEFKSAMEQMRQKGPPPPPPPSTESDASDEDAATAVFDKLDTNKDGVVSMDELLAELTSKTEETGSETETSETDQTSFEQIFKAVDSDGDGSITQSELTDFLKKIWALQKTFEPGGSYGGDGTVSATSAVGENLSVSA